MLRGLTVRRDMARELENAHAAYADAAEALREVEVRHARLLDREGRILEKLARLYLPDLSPQSVSAGLDALRHRLEEALAAQEERRRRLEGDATQAAERVEAARGRLGELEEEAQALDGELAGARARVEAVLGADEGHAEQTAEHEALTTLRARLLKRRERLGAAASAERHRYERDRLFRYLHDRGYGGPAYRAGPVTKRLDRWLAGRIEYDTLARSYRILRVGPRQIGAEIRRITRRAEELEKAIDAREEEVARREGLLPLLERRRDLEARAGPARGELERARSSRESLEAELRAIEAKRGRHFEKAVEMYREHLGGKTVRELETLARSTADPGDDGLVQELDGVRSKLEAVRNELALRREELQRASRRADRLAELSGSDVEGAQSHDSLVEEVPRPYFDALYRELTAAFDAGLVEDSVVEAEWEMEGEVETEVVIQDADGRVIRRRVTRRSLGSPPEEPG